MLPQTAQLFIIQNIKFRAEVAGEVISGTALDYVGVDVLVKFGDYISNRS